MPKFLRITALPEKEAPMASIARTIVNGHQGLILKSTADNQCVLEVSDSIKVETILDSVRKQAQKILGISADVEILEQDPTLDTIFSSSDIWNLSDGDKKKVEVDGREFEVKVFHDTSADNKPVLNFLMFITGTKTRYSRKTIALFQDGTISEDQRGIIPDFDKTDNEPVFTSSNREILRKLIQAFLLHTTN